MMRHTFAAHLAEKGMSFSNIQKLLGHKMMKSTRIYTLLFTHAQKKIRLLYVGAFLGILIICNNRKSKILRDNVRIIGVTQTFETH